MRLRKCGPLCICILLASLDAQQDKAKEPAVSVPPSSQDTHKKEDPDGVAPTSLIATFTVMPPTRPLYRVSDGADVSFPWNISGLEINGAAVACEQYTRETAIGRFEFAKFRRDGDFFFITTKSFGELQMKVIEERPLGPSMSGVDMPPPAYEIKSEIWATSRQTSEVLDQLLLKKKDSKSVSYKSGDETVQAVLYTPAGRGSFPAIIVIHEWWGLNDWVKDQAAKLAGEGYVALAIDLYRGKVATTPEMAHEIMRGVPEDRAKRDLHAAFEFLQSQPNVRKDRIGAIGWCMGGGYSLDVALQEPTLAADVINYGRLATDPEAIKKINAPILGLFGALDQGIPAHDVNKFAETLQEMGKKIEVKIYDDAGHAFENPNNKDGYRAADAADAWKRTVTFLAGTLKK